MRKSGRLNGSEGMPMQRAGLAPARVNPVVQHPHEQRVSLGGEWRFRLDPDDRGVAEGWHGAPESMAERIQVPGCWQGQGFGGDGTDRVRDFNLEARVFRATYKGTGWYARQFVVPREWEGRRIWMNFGGVHPGAEVWVNGERVGENGMPFVPFAFDITSLVRRSGSNDVVVRVHERNREYGLAFDWQGNWSGLYRGVDLTATGPAWFERCAVLADAEARSLRVRAVIGGDAAGREGAKIRVALRAADGSEALAAGEWPVTGAETDVSLAAAGVGLWSPDAPTLCRVDVELAQGGDVCDARSERTGFVSLKADGKRFLINGEPYYMRGSGDFISCPETGCPDTDRERWRRKLKALREYGYNYVRCQSYVYPPEYFDAADEVGLLVQSEMGILGAWGGTSPWHVYQWPKPTPDHYPVLKRQWDLVVERDAAHPSATLYCMSNEYGGNTDFPRIAWECYRNTKAIKPAAMVIWTDGGYNKDLPGDFVNHGVNAFKPEELAALTKPLIQHEYQWWSSFPDVRLEGRFTGALRPYSQQLARHAAAAQGQAHLLERYAECSQRLQLIEAKAKMEAMRRDNPTLAGICHFDAMDANPSPQGIINEFYERKLADAAQWLETNGDAVLLCSLGFDDRVRVAGSSVNLAVSVSDFGHPSFVAPQLNWRLTAGGRTLASGNLAYHHEPYRTCPVGAIEFVVPAVAEAVSARLEVALQEGSRVVRNAWDLWLLPSDLALPDGVAAYGQPAHSWLKQWAELPRVAAESLSGGDGRVVLTERLDRPLADFVGRGGRVVLVATEGMVRPHPPNFGYVKYFFTPPANYSPYEDGQNGTVIADHPMLRGVPHDGFADWQFFRMIENAPPLDLGPLGLTRGEPVIRCIHRYPVCRPLAYLCEVGWGRGRLIISALGLDPQFPEARWLLRGIVGYAREAGAEPAMPMDEAALGRLIEATGLP